MTSATWSTPYIHIYPAPGEHYVQVWKKSTQDVFRENASDSPVAITVLGGATLSTPCIDQVIQQG